MSETIGLDIGSHSIKLVGLKMTSKGPFLTHVGIKTIPAGIEKQDVEHIAEVLKNLFNESGIKSKKVRFTVSGSDIHIRRIILPSMPKAELKEAIRWEIKGSNPFPIETARIDFHILGEILEDKVKKLDIMVIACPNQLIDHALSIAKRAGLQPVHLDVESFVLWNALITWGKLKQEETVALIDLGANKTGIYLFKDGALQFSRETSPAGADITRAIVEGIGSGEESNLLYERAEKIKEALGISSDGSQEKIPDESVNISKVIFHMRPVLERMTAEIGRSLDYYRNQFNVDRIDRVLLTGGGAYLKNFTSHLAKELLLPVENFNPLRGILFDSKKIDVQLLEQMGSKFTIAAGSALPLPERIELLPAKEPMMSKARIIKSIPFMASIIVLFAFSFFVWHTSGQMITLKQERDAKAAKVANIEMLQVKLALLKEKENKMKQELSLLPSSAIVSVPYAEILGEISQMIPDNVTLTLVSVQSKENPLKKEGQTSTSQDKESQQEQGRELHIAGLAFGSDMSCLTALAQMIEAMDKSPLFKNTKLLSADENKLYNRSGSAFEMVCDINTEKAPRP